ncbi:MAG: hypothetical protein E5V79_02420, partial [Mesorhizobium sp.]
MTRSRADMTIEHLKLGFGANHLVPTRGVSQHSTCARDRAPALISIKFPRSLVVMARLDSSLPRGYDFKARRASLMDRFIARENIKHFVD